MLTTWKEYVVLGAIALMMTWVLDGLAEYQSPRAVKCRQQQSHDHQETSDNRESGSRESNPISRKTGPVAGSINADKENDCSDGESNPWGKPIERIGACLLLGTMLVIWWQTRATWVAANAAQQGAETANKALHMLERAMIVMKPPLIEHVPPRKLKSPRRPYILKTHLRLRNSGRSIATRINYKCGLRWYAKLPDLLDESAVSAWNPNLPLSADAILKLPGPGADPYKLPSWEAERAIGTPFLYLFGYVDYIDAFNEPHRTGFCYYFAPDYPIPVRAPNEAYNYNT